MDATALPLLHRIIQVARCCALWILGYAKCVLRQQPERLVNIYQLKNKFQSAWEEVLAIVLLLLCHSLVSADFVPAGGIGLLDAHDCTPSLFKTRLCTCFGKSIPIYGCSQQFDRSYACDIHG